jgi:glyoxylase-like metal-dependent hydrolase (beta-lactamase superfamily II)
MLDAGSSPAHTREFLDWLATEGVAPPGAVVYTHFHWDHVLGGAETGALVIAQRLTAGQLLELAARDWSDAGLDRRVAEGLASPNHAVAVKAELPSPREVVVAPADVVFDEAIDIDLGGVVVRVRHVGGDHSPDSCVMLVEPDRLLFIGDCLGASLQGTMTAKAAFALRDTAMSFDAQHFVEGHHDAVSSPEEMEVLFEKMRVAEESARDGAALPDMDEDTAYYHAAFAAGLSSEI